MFFTLLNVCSFTNHTFFCSDKNATNKGVDQPKDANFKKDKNDVVLKSCLSSPDNPATKKRKEALKVEGKERRVYFELGDNVVHTVPKWDCGKRISRKKKKRSLNVPRQHPCGHAHTKPTKQTKPTKPTKQTSSSGAWYYTLQEKVLACIVFVILCVVIVFYSLLKSKNRYKLSRNKKLFKEKKG